jgi:hypothetical protein
MLDKLPFDQAMEMLEQIQDQLKAGGWQPWEVDRSEWFDLSAEGKKRLHAAMFEHPYHQQQTLRVPKKYGMTLRFMCAEGCWTREPPYRFLIDVGVASDVHESEPGDPPVWDKSHPVHQ